MTYPFSKEQIEQYEKTKNYLSGFAFRTSQICAGCNGYLEPSNANKNLLSKGEALCYACQGKEWLKVEEPVLT